MADDNIDFRFLGQQVKNLQADVRDLRAAHLRLEGDVVELRSDIARLAEQVDNHHRANQAQFPQIGQVVDNHHRANQVQFEQQSQQAATNMQVLLAAIARKD